MTDRTEIRSTRTPRTGRRPGTSSSRDDILAAARRLFAERGYTGATMRAIAAEAGVDAALVVHFFGSKPALLGEAVEWPFDPDVEMPRLLSGGRSHVGAHLVGLFVRTWDEEATRNPILPLLLAATTEPQAAEMMSEFTRLRLFTPLMERLRADQPELRADLVASQLIGLGRPRCVLGLEPLSSAKPDQLIRCTAPTIQRYLTGKL